MKGGFTSRRPSLRLNSHHIAHSPEERSNTEMYAKITKCGYST